MKEFILLLIWSAGIFAFGVIIGCLSWQKPTILDQAIKAIEDCQKDLPRSQVCELTAKVKEVEK